MSCVSVSMFHPVNHSINFDDVFIEESILNFIAEVSFGADYQT
jgi:hypothetical protein